MTVLLLALPLVAACAKAPPSDELPGDVRVAIPTEGPTPIAAPRRPDPAALAELVAAAPKTTATSTTSTLVGTDTGIPTRKASAERSTTDGLTPPRMTARPPLSSPALERAARAQLYWPLARACRLSNGELPPTESVLLDFEIQADGSVYPGSVAATAADERHRGVAECVERVFSASGFRGPAEGRGSHTSVRIGWPSVD